MVYEYPTVCRVRMYYLCSVLIVFTFFARSAGFSGEFFGRWTIGAIWWQPMEGWGQFRSQLHTFGVDLETALKDFAATACQVQVTASGLGVDDFTPAVLQLFKAAAATLLA